MEWLELPLSIMYNQIIISYILAETNVSRVTQECEIRSFFSVRIDSVSREQTVLLLHGI